MSIIRPTALRFLITGVIVNVSLYALFALLIFMDVEYRIAATITYMLGILWGYLQNRIWSWRSSAPVTRSLPRYLAAYALIYLLHITFMTLLVDVLTVTPLLSGLISAVALIVPLFCVLDRFVFKEPANASR